LCLVPARLRGSDDLYNCDRQCRWSFGFFNRSITGMPAAAANSCQCQQRNVSLGSAPAATDRPYDGPPTVPNSLFFPKPCCAEPPGDLPLEQCREPSKKCHANRYPNTKQFDAGSWAGNYTTDYLCVLDTSTHPDPDALTAKPFTISMSPAMHEACYDDTDNSTLLQRCKQGRTDLNAQNLTVLHCGKCSACSHVTDLEVLFRTRDTITSEMTACSTKFVIAHKLHLPGRNLEDLKTCLRNTQNSINFTDDGRAWTNPTDMPTCMDVWTDNIMNDATLCQSLCLTKFIKTANTGNFAKDQCLQCDEYTSGPAFIKGAGANRRSTGVTSDIDRTQLKGTQWEQRICKIGFYSPN